MIFLLIKEDSRTRKQLCKSSRKFNHTIFFRAATPRDTMSTLPDTSGILCCEVCGKYGLPQEFSASGRFCSLSCVGVYTGRRNKGREYVRHAKTIDGKIVKRKKKGKKPALLASEEVSRSHVSIL